MDQVYEVPSYPVFTLPNESDGDSILREGESADDTSQDGDAMLEDENNQPNQANHNTEPTSQRPGDKSSVVHYVD